MSADLMSRVYQPDPTRCCEACVFGRGDHARWCSQNWTPEDWICAACRAKDPAYADAEQVSSSGLCERCVATQTPIFRRRERGREEYEGDPNAPVFQG